MKYNKMTTKQLKMFDIGMSMAYDRGAVSVIDLIRNRGMVNTVDNMDKLHLLQKEIEDDIRKEEIKLTKV